MFNIELWRSAFDSLLVNKLRSVLTMIGIIVGVGSIITIVAIGQGGKSAILNEIQSANPQDTVEIIPKSLLSAQGQANPSQIRSFSPSDFQLVRGFSGVKDVYTTPQTSDTLSYAGKRESITVTAGPSYLPSLDKFKISAGRMYLPMDNTAHRHVAVLSTQVAKDLFNKNKPQDAVGHFVSLQGQLLQVIGISKSTNSSPLANLVPNKNVYVPTSTFSDLYPGKPIYTMDIRTQTGQNKKAISARVIAVLNAKYHSNAFTDASSYITSVTNLIGKVTTTITVIIGAIAGIALLVGGIGVMNIMLVSVTERTREIGIRMSLGATRTTILWQFLVEAMVLTTLGGGIGIVLGWLTAVIVSASFHLSALVSWQSVVGSFLFSAIIGIICGLYPASRASRLNPIESLRYE
ncbi:ABC transporter permease [Alicyclobacillus sp. SO9]|uniref:ABC transporter permease n=1 Tax=Alicyclobacillus sp. SO9 TaxID=2665646 RepID=UPI0018E81A90|nr:ABC transporter permease [Alicyclobacillus sp. SO9]QQE80262.1 ABC transporter permease [Alicyclobacillus sp. SO9]